MKTGRGEQTSPGEWWRMRYLMPHQGSPDTVARVFMLSDLGESLLKLYLTMKCMDESGRLRNLTKFWSRNESLST